MTMSRVEVITSAERRRTHTRRARKQLLVRKPVTPRRCRCQSRAGETLLNDPQLLGI